MENNMNNSYENTLENTFKPSIDNNMASKNISSEIIRKHKVGSLTLGISLIIFGVLFIFKTFTNYLTYEFVLKLWPIIFILLGFEVLISYFTNKEDRLIYDKGAIFLLILLSIFAMGMALAEFLVNYANNFYFY